MNNLSVTQYQDAVQSRSLVKFVIGLIPRLRSFIFNSICVWIAQKKGAHIGKQVSLPYRLAKKANKNLSIGDHSSIQTDLIDLRSPVAIGSHVIVGSGVEILTTSHFVDSQEWEHKHYGITIEDYAWIATRAFVLPSCRKIGLGAVCAAGSVVAKEVPKMAIVAGNPAELIRQRADVHSNLIVESLLGNDLISYIRARRKKRIRGENCKHRLHGNE